MCRRYTCFIGYIYKLYAVYMLYMLYLLQLFFLSLQVYTCVDAAYCSIMLRTLFHAPYILYTAAGVAVRCIVLRPSVLRVRY